MQGSADSAKQSGPASTSTCSYGVLLYCAKPDDANNWHGPAIVNGKLYDVNRPKQYEPSQNSVAATNWKTYLLDDTGLSSLKKTLVYCDGTFGTLAVTNKRKGGSLKGRFPWSYDISLLQVALDEPKKTIVLVGSEDLATAEEIKEGHSTVDGIKNLKEMIESGSGHTDHEEDTHDTEIRLISIIETDISLQRVIKGTPFGAAHTWYERKWETYELARDKETEIICKPLDHSLFSGQLLQKLNQEFDANVELASGFADADSRWDNFFLLPAVGGPQVLFGVAAVATEVHGTVIEIPGGSLQGTAALTTSPENSDGRTIAVSPDEQFTIAKDDDQIVCRFKTGKEIQVMPASSFRGWKWIPLNQQNMANWKRFHSKRL
ncbi:MAG: hypothetical protein K2X27_16900 [Candidatus Obscuribacterales bacterium]|nr:hypothetical protein [Candidatus Obscuribacterales bacterium]